VQSTITIGLFLISTFALAQLEDFPNVNFKKADSIAGLFPKHSLSDLQSLADKLTQPLPTPVEKFRSIFMWVCQNIENDQVLFYRFKYHNQRKSSDVKHERWLARYKADVFKTLRDNHRTTCSGYAYLIRELAIRAGIPAIIINGYGRTAHANVGGEGTVNHAWNAVQLNNTWYLCDAIWASGWIDGDKHVYMKRFDDTYFLTDPKLFAFNHFPENPNWFLLEDKPTLDQFLNQPIQYAATLRLKILTKSPERFSIRASKGEPIHFWFDHTDKSFERIELKVVEAGEVRSYFPAIESPCEKEWSISHTFQSRGVRTLHILLDNNFVYSYQVSVR
jgi:hypothetical protein